MPSFLFVTLPIVCESPSSLIPRVLYHIYSHILEPAIPKSMLHGYWVYTFREKCPLHHLSPIPCYDSEPFCCFWSRQRILQLVSRRLRRGLLGLFHLGSDMVHAYDFT
jgi:hypothetical protein